MKVDINERIFKDRALVHPKIKVAREMKAAREVGDGKETATR